MILSMGIPSVSDLWVPQKVIQITSWKDREIGEIGEIERSRDPVGRHVKKVAARGSTKHVCEYQACMGGREREDGGTGAS